MSDICVVLLVLGMLLSGLLMALFAKVRAVHALVNSRAQEQDNTIRALKAANETLTATNLSLERTQRGIRSDQSGREPA